MAQAVLDALFGMGRLQALVDDDGIENIDINGCDQVWATFADGSKRSMGPVADSDDELVDLLRSAAGRFGLTERRFDTARPELDLQLPGGARLSAVMAVAARPSVSIRRHRFADLSLDELCAMGAMDEGLSSLLASAVRARKNIVVSGAMNSGKTTCSGHSPPRSTDVSGSSRSSRPSNSAWTPGRRDIRTWWRSRRGRPTSRGRVGSRLPTWSVARCG